MRVIFKCHCGKWAGAVWKMWPLQTETGYVCVHVCRNGHCSGAETMPTIAASTGGLKIVTSTLLKPWTSTLLYLFSIPAINCNSCAIVVCLHCSLTKHTHKQAVCKNAKTRDTKWLPYFNLSTAFTACGCFFYLPVNPVIIRTTCSSDGHYVDRSIDHHTNRDCDDKYMDFNMNSFASSQNVFYEITEGGFSGNLCHFIWKSHLWG